MQLKITDVRKMGKYNIICNTEDGSSYILKQKFHCDDVRIRPTLERIEKAGQINTDFWIKSAKAL